MAEREPKFEEKIEEPKRESGILKYVGFNPEQEESISEHFKEKFKNQEGEDIAFRKYEREKTEDEKRMIADILEKMPEFIEKYGGKPLNITLDHIHILDKAKMDEETKRKMEEAETGVAYLATHELLFIFDTGNNLKNALHIVHELIHFNSFQSVELKKVEKPEFKLRRMGFEIHTKNVNVFFKDINEAVTVELEKRFDNQHFESIDAISNDAETRNRIKWYAKGKGDDIALAITKQLESGEWQTIIENYTYPKERKKLNKIIEEIYEANKEEEGFNSPEDVFDIFAQAVMTGRLLKIADLCERTYGKGSFRALGEETKKK